MALTEEQKEQRKRHEELFRFILEKNGMTYTEFRLEVMHDFVVCNLDELPKEERRRFKVSLKTKTIPTETKEEKEKIKELFKLIVNKLGVNYVELWSIKKQHYIVSNKDIFNTFSAEECERFNLHRYSRIRTYDKVEISELTKEERDEVRKQTKEMVGVLLKRTGTKRKEIIEQAYQDFIYNNDHLLKKSEKKKFDKLVEYYFISCRIDE